MALPPRSQLTTHEVQNQPEIRSDLPLWSGDPVLREAAAREGADCDALADHALRLGRMAERAREAMRHGPELLAFDAAGRRMDEVRYHPSYHDFMQLGIGAGYVSRAWEGEGGGHATHAAMVYLHSQVEPGSCCPMTMTYAGLAVVEGVWRAALISREYDPRVLPLSQKRGATLGMAMTEKQGGSDVRMNSTRAEMTADGWRLSGHKWFCSAPMSDGFLTLAQTEAGLSCFLVPRWLEGERNAVRLLRLKDKLGNRSNASAEIEYEGALAWPVGEPGQGIRAILPMVHHTRLDTALAPAGLMRAALTEALHWVEGRRTFQRRLIDQPLMRGLLADLALDWEGALVLSMRVARAYDEGDSPLARVAVALAKFLNNRRCPEVVAECMEIRGGMGYVEDTPLPMLYREAPLNAIWEGSSNVICLDILRTLARDPAAGEALMAEIAAATGADARFDAALRAHRTRWPGLPAEAEARWFAERLAVLLTASLLIRHGPAAVADGYVATRLDGERGRLAGSVSGLNEGALIDRLGQA